MRVLALSLSAAISIIFHALPEPVFAWSRSSSVPENSFEEVDIEVTYPSPDGANPVLSDQKTLFGADSIVLRLDVGLEPRMWGNIFVYDEYGTLTEHISQNEVPAEIDTILTDKIFGKGYRVGINSLDGTAAKIRITGEFSSGTTGQWDSVFNGAGFEPVSGLANGPLAHSVSLLAAIIVDYNDPQLTDKAPVPADVCTGMMIAPDLLLTAGHCVKFDEDFCEGTLAIFGMYHGATEPPQTRRCVEVVYLGHSLDAALLRLDGSPSAGPFPRLPTVGAVQQTVRILQHPGGNFARISQDSDCVVESPIASLWPQSDRATTSSTKDTAFIHTCDTLNGSSGAPVLSEDGAMILGVHNSGTSNGLNYATRGDLIRHCIGYRAFNQFDPQPDDLLCR